MNRKKFGIVLLAGTLLLTAMGYGSGIMASDILSNLSGNASRQIKSKNTLNISLDKTVPEDVRTYAPQFYETSMFLARMYADFFKIEGEPHDTHEYFLFSNDKESLYVYKFTSMIRYQLHTDGATDMEAEGFTESHALSTAESFIESKFLSSNYEDAAVNLIDGMYKVRLMNRIGNLKNYGFPNEITVDKQGRVRAMTYHFITYESLGSVPVKSMYEAYSELSSNTENVVINNCRMVYIYKDSILQPAYMFQGTTAVSNYFEGFVIAAVYGIDK